MKSKPGFWKKENIDKLFYIDQEKRKKTQISRIRNESENITTDLT